MHLGERMMVKEHSNLMLQIIHKGKMMSRSTNHDTTNKLKEILAPSSFLLYLKSLADSMKISLMSCSSSVAAPALVNLYPSHHTPMSGISLEFYPRTWFQENSTVAHDLILNTIERHLLS
jgi:hypothetical protein